jgi:molybdopterin-guanine dinucleotide biosynthesis protein A
MSLLEIILLAAGNSRRFQLEGYEIPKPFLKVDFLGKIQPMCYHVIDTIKHIGPIVRLVVKKEDLHYTEYNSYVRAFPIIESQGQADSLLQIVRELKRNCSVLVLDCDMLLRPHDLQYLIDAVSLYEVAVSVARTFDPNASTVDQIPFPTQFREKECASEWGIVGARAFRNSMHLQSALEEYIQFCNSYGEIESFLTPAINYIKGKKYAHVVGDYVDWGTQLDFVKAGRASYENSLSS